jgi:hypothetical protein
MPINEFLVSVCEIGNYAVKEELIHQSSCLFLPHPHNNFVIHGSIKIQRVTTETEIVCARSNST